LLCRIFRRASDRTGMRLYLSFQAKDAAIDERLKKIGITSVRVPGKLIVNDLKAAADLVSGALDA
jgi:hypothetical protein